jgi:purine nucleoside phosphorylase
MPYTYDYFQKSVDYLKEKVDFTPEIAIILGSCLGPFAEEIENPIVVDYKDIPCVHSSFPRGQADLRHCLRPQGRLYVRPLPLL